MPKLSLSGIAGGEEFPGAVRAEQPEAAAVAAASAEADAQVSFACASHPDPRLTCAP